MKRKCSMCGEVKDEIFFRIINAKRNDIIKPRFMGYCKKCELLYSKEYKRIKRAYLKDLKEVVERDENR